MLRVTALVEVQPGEAAHAQLRTWLDAAALTTSDLAEGRPRNFALNDASGDPVAFGGLAGVEPDLLLRSVVVQPSVRRGGLGARLVTAFEGEARTAGASALWLLTQGAAFFFTRQEFAPAERGASPTSIAASSQFRGLCPASAALMRKPLDGAMP